MVRLRGLVWVQSLLEGKKQMVLLWQGGLENTAVEAMAFINMLALMTKIACSCIL